MAGLQTKMLLVVGKSGNGKSYLTDEVIAAYRGQVIIIDGARERDGITDLTTFARRMAVNNLLNRKSVLVYSGKNQAVFDVLYEYLQSVRNTAWGRSRKLLVVDEAHAFTSLLGGRGAGNVLDYLTRERRHINLDIIMVAHRLTDFPVHMRGNASMILSFALTEKIDYKGAQDYLDNIDEVRNLRIGEKIVLYHNTRKGGEIFKSNIGGEKILKIMLE